MLSKLEKYKNLDIQMFLNQSIRDLEEVIIELNRDQMWSDGTVNVKKPHVQLSYSPVTVPLKREFARYKKTDFITLRWDGDFYESLFIEYRPDSFVIKSNDPKWSFSLEPQTRFENALGLTRGSKAKLRELIKSSMLRKLRNAV